MTTMLSISIDHSKCVSNRTQMICVTNLTRAGILLTVEWACQSGNKMRCLSWTIKLWVKGSYPAWWARRLQTASATLTFWLTKGNKDSQMLIVARSRHKHLDPLPPTHPFLKNSFTIRRLRNVERFTTLALSVIRDLLQTQTAIRNRCARLLLH